MKKIFIAFVLLLINVPLVFASSLGFNLEDSNSFSISPGMETTVNFTVSNLGNKDGLFKIEHFNYDFDSETDLSEWVVAADNDGLFELKAQQDSIPYELKLNIPKDTELGEYVLAVRLMEVEDSNNESSLTTISVKSAILLRLYIDVVDEDFLDAPSNVEIDTTSTENVDNTSLVDDSVDTSPAVNDNLSKLINWMGNNINTVLLLFLILILLKNNNSTNVNKKKSKKKRS